MIGERWPDMVEGGIGERMEMAQLLEGVIAVRGRGEGRLDPQRGTGQLLISHQLMDERAMEGWQLLGVSRLLRRSRTGRLIGGLTTMTTRTKQPRGGRGCDRLSAIAKCSNGLELLINEAARSCTNVTCMLDGVDLEEAERKFQ